ncbi:hypothetical protein C439_13409 [Haloferax mediterranei ATCC 33500]|nr:hypothetical protein C439_13409 [Haloferax mediterranei ATCC 33500]
MPVGGDDMPVRRHANANGSCFVADGERPSRPTHNWLAFCFPFCTPFPPCLDCGAVARNLDDSPDNGRPGDIGEVAHPPSGRPFDETAAVTYVEPRDESPTEVSGTAETTGHTPSGDSR